MHSLFFAVLSIFWVSGFLLFYIYFGYPLLLAIISSFVPKRQPKPGFTPTISILIAAYNEEAGIARKLEQTLALDYPADKIEILVLSDSSSDRTDEVVLSFKDPRIRLLRVSPRLGKTNAQNHGVPEAHGDILVFSDATTIYHRQALRYLACNYENPRVGAVSGRYQYFDVHDSTTGTSTVAFWNYENWIKTMQSRIRTISGCCGCIYSVRRSVYTKLPHDIISDLVQPLWAIKKGFLVKFEDRALAYEETTKSAAEEFSMRVRVVTRGMRGVLSVADLLNPLAHPWIAFQLTSHKVLRWLAGFFLLALFASSAVLAAKSHYVYVFLLQALFYGCALVSTVIHPRGRFKILGIPLYFCTLNWAAIVSLKEIMIGRRYVTWETVRSEGVQRT